jgi:hypothetical protein
MVRNSGKVSILFFLMCFSACAAEISLHVTTKKGVPLDKLPLGETCVMECIVRGDEVIKEGPYIKGLREDMVLEKGITQSLRPFMSPSKEIHYKYMIRCDKVGSFTLGPARVVTEKGTYDSAPLQMNVVPRDAHTEQEQPAVFAELIIEKRLVYHHEKVPYVIRLYYQERSIALQSARPLKFLGDDTTVVGSSGSSKMHNGERYACAEWRGTWYPDKVGRITIPPIRIDYKTNERTSLLSGFLSAMDTHHEYTQSVELIVEPIPATKEPIQLIGTMSGFTAQIEPQEAHEGDAMVFTLELRGSGTIEKCKHPKISLPSEFTWYESERTLQGEEPEITCRFSYIVQGMKKGRFEIPGQSLTYLDTKTHHVLTITTVPLIVTVHPAVVSVKEENKSTALSSDDGRIPLVSTSIYSSWWGWWLPRSVVLPLLLLPLCFLFLLVMCCGWLYYQGSNGWSWYRKRMVKKTLRTIQQACSRQDIVLLYTAMLHYITAYNQADEQLFFSSSEEQAAWQRWWARVVAVRFGPSGDNLTKELYAEAATWIIKLGKHK